MSGGFLSPEIAAPLATAVFGIIAAYIVKRLSDHHERKQRRRALACVLAAELKGWLVICEARGYDAFGENFLASLKSGQDRPMPRLTDERMTSFEVGRGAFPVAYNNLDDLGLLGPSVSSEIAQFLSLHQGLTSDIVAYARGKWDHHNLKVKVHSVEENLKLYRECVSLAQGLVSKLLELAK